MRDNRLLFAENDLRLVLEAHERKMLGEIDGIEPDRLLNTSDDDWCAYLMGEYTVEVPVLEEDAITVGQRETKIDVSRDRSRAIFDRSRAFHVPGTAVSFHVPFTGDAELFRCRASTYTYNPPRASIEGHEVRFVYERTDHEPETVKRAFDTDLGSVQQHLGYIRNDVEPFNARLESTARARLGARRQKLLADRGLVASLGFPMRERPSETRTYVAPDVRRKLPSPRPPAGTPPFAPEPALSMEHYEHILSVAGHMVAVMERSPAAFRTMSEEDLRQHFLVQLNGQYEGQATGETFNFEGKTDIVIRSEGRNLFIAECKIWKGPQALTSAIDQLLGYATWRDTKTAILLFNRTKNLSAVVDKVPAVVEQHPTYKRTLPYESETGHRFVLHHKDDPGRELILTVLVFEVPA